MPVCRLAAILSTRERKGFQLPRPNTLSSVRQWLACALGRPETLHATGLYFEVEIYTIL